MESKPDTIKISAAQREEVQATFADLFVAIQGASLVSGDSALKKAREVSQLVEELTRFGLPAEAIHLQSVRAEAASGGLLRTSNATYRLKIRCEKLDHFTDLLGIIGNQKNATFERVEWKYPDEAIQTIALEKALVKAADKARNIAEKLGVQLLGVYNLTETALDFETPAPQSFFAAQAKSPASRSAGFTPSPNLGMDIQHSKLIEARVEVEYRVSAFDVGDE